MTPSLGRPRFRESSYDRTLRHLGFLLALAIAAAAVGFQFRQHADALRGRDRFNLPAFDPYVYVAMAEQPAFFTVAPWGYRILTPWIAHAFPRKPLATYRSITFLALCGAGGLLFLYLRRLGHGAWAALLGVLVFCLSGPVAESIQAPFLGEPIALLLETALLFAIEAGAGVATLGLLFALFAFSKEIFVLFVPLVYLSLRTRLGSRRAIGAALLAVLPALFLGPALRFWWTPQIHTPRAPIDLGLIRLFVGSVLGAWQETGSILLLGGLTPLAVLGALRPKARYFVERAGYLAPATMAAALVAWINVPSPTAVILLGGNVMRLLAYALPVLIPLALVAIDRVLPHMRDAPPPMRPRAALETAALFGLALCLAFPFVALDRYRRVPLHSTRNGIYVFTLCHESLETARKLERGESVSWDLGELTFDPATAEDNGKADRMRWFLREGWGPNAFGGEARVAGRSASLLLPALQPRDRELVLAFGASSPEPIELLANGIRVATAELREGVADQRFRIPARLLFRGDNLLTLTRSTDSQPGPRLHEIEIR